MNFVTWPDSVVHSILPFMYPGKFPIVDYRAAQALRGSPWAVPSGA